jgi:hypothetical protein
MEEEFAVSPNIITCVYVPENYNTAQNYIKWRIIIS